MKQVTVFGLFCLLLILITQNGCTKKEPPPEQGKVITDSIGMKLVYIPAGSFMMGSRDSKDGLLPQHEVRISKGFWMGQTEVTKGQYESVMNAQPWSGKVNVRADPNSPAVYVSWDDAEEFCRKLSQQEGSTYRLPTEAEWEYACRAGTTTRFSFGDSDSSLGDYAWYASNAFHVDERYAHPVRQKKPNPWGLYDMHGNVWEWCSDYYDKDYYSSSPNTYPKGPPTASSRCLRGGCWIRTEYALRCSSRISVNPGDRPSYVGIRVVRSQS